jgi:hypothetical protein
MLRSQVRFLLAPPFGQHVCGSGRPFVWSCTTLHHEKYANTDAQLAFRWVVLTSAPQ